MENDYFAEFLDLTKTLNYMETAENMNISTSALSKHIMKLEQEVGVSFFDRTTRTVKLNRYGRLFGPGIRRTVWPGLRRSERGGADRADAE